MNSEARLDNIDWLILEELQRNARATFSEIGRQVGLTSPAVAERVRRMEEAGIIEGYRADINLSKVGYPLQAIVRLALPNGCLPGHGMALSRMPEVLDCYQVTGEDCYILRCALESPEHLEKFISELVQQGPTRTSVVLSCYPGQHLIQSPDRPK